MNAERERKEKKQNYKTSLEEEKEEDDDNDDDDVVYYFKLLFTSINQQCVYFWELWILQLFDCFATQSMLCSSLSLSLS
jgi:hypothetical protein